MTRRQHPQIKQDCNATNIQFPQNTINYNTYIYIHDAYIHDTYVHDAYIRAYICVYIRAYIHANMPTYIYTYTYAYHFYNLDRGAVHYKGHALRSSKPSLCPMPIHHTE